MKECEVVTLSCRRTQRHLSLRFLFCKTFMETEETRSDINFNNIIFMAFGRRHYSGGLRRYQQRHKLCKWRSWLYLYLAHDVNSWFYIIIICTEESTVMLEWLDDGMHWCKRMICFWSSTTSRLFYFHYLESKGTGRAAMAWDWDIWQLTCKLISEIKETSGLFYELLVSPVTNNELRQDTQPDSCSWNEVSLCLACRNTRRFHSMSV